MTESDEPHDRGGNPVLLPGGSGPGPDLGPRPAAGPPSPAAGPPSPTAGPLSPVASNAPRRQRRWALVVTAAAAVVGLIAGLVIWAPWRSPPLLRPTGLGAGTVTISTITFRWSG